MFASTVHSNFVLSQEENKQELPPTRGKPNSHARVRTSCPVSGLHISKLGESQSFVAPPEGLFNRDSLCPHTE